MAHAQVMAAFEALKEEKYLSREESLSITLNNLYSAHKCCYIARVENTNPLNSSKLCEADYYICFLRAFIYYKKSTISG
ncbi:MAG: hypothetical protein F6K24_26155 [Okeania sp. SIO2D1]|nr:hypothetical protein [Okeania sp. SIO2D1]